MLIISRLFKTAFFLFSSLFIINTSFAQPISIEEIKKNVTWGPEWTFKPTGLKDEQRFHGYDPYPLSDKSWYGKFYYTAFGDAVASSHLINAQLKGTAGTSRYGFISYQVDKKTDWIQLSLDPDVIEVQASPKTWEDFEKQSQFIQKSVFEAAKKIRLEPHRYEGAGHIHVDFDYLFKDRPLLFRNFLVDMINHYELGGGLLGENRTDGYGQTLSSYGPDAILKFKRAIEKWDSLPLEQQTSESLRDLITEVYLETEGKEKFHAINISRTSRSVISGSRTIELRFLRPQKNMNEFLLLIKLFSYRIAYLSNLTHRISISEYIPTVMEAPAKHAIENFIAFIKEAGLKPAEFITLLQGTYLKEMQTVVTKPDQNLIQSLEMKFKDLTDSITEDSQAYKYLVDQIKNADDVELLVIGRILFRGPYNSTKAKLLSSFINILTGEDGTDPTPQKIIALFETLTSNWELLPEDYKTLKEPLKLLLGGGLGHKVPENILKMISKVSNPENIIYEKFFYFLIEYSSYAYHDEARTIDKSSYIKTLFELFRHNQSLLRKTGYLKNFFYYFSINDLNYLALKILELPNKSPEHYILLASLKFTNKRERTSFLRNILKNEANGMASLNELSMEFIETIINSLNFETFQNDKEMLLKSLIESALEDKTTAAKRISKLINLKFVKRSTSTKLALISLNELVKDGYSISDFEGDLEVFVKNITGWESIISTHPNPRNHRFFSRSLNDAKINELLESKELLTLPAEFQLKILQNLWFGLRKVEPSNHALPLEDFSEFSIMFRKFLKLHSTVSARLNAIVDVVIEEKKAQSAVAPSAQNNRDHAIKCEKIF